MPSSYEAVRPPRLVIVNDDRIQRALWDCVKILKLPPSYQQPSDTDLRSISKSTTQAKVTISPIQSLPPELLETIFQYVIQGHDLAEVYFIARALAHTHPHWRQVLGSTIIRIYPYELRWSRTERGFDLVRELSTPEKPHTSAYSNRYCPRQSIYRRYRERPFFWTTKEVRKPWWWHHIKYLGIPRALRHFENLSLVSLHTRDCLLPRTHVSKDFPIKASRAKTKKSNDRDNRDFAKSRSKCAACAEGVPKPKWNPYALLIFDLGTC